MMKFRTSFFLLMMTAMVNTVFAQTVDTLVALTNYGLHFRIVQGKGVPIVFESGAGNDGSVWRGVQASLSQRIKAPLIAYDRAGFGHSSIDIGNINIARCAV